MGPGNDERVTMRKVFWRLMPLLMFGSAMAYLDRVNLGFAALTMNRDLGLSAAAFGVASGAFFITYAVFEIPSNMVLARVGARRWLARIMISWGLISAGMALVTDFRSLVAFRMLLGLAEAGFTPGVLLLMTHWFPQRYRGRAVAAFLTAQVVGVIFGASVSGPLLAMSAWGLHGWQLMFILQGAPTVFAGLLLLATFVERPADAKWLTASEKGWLDAELEAERRLVGERAGAASVVRAMFQPRVLLLTAGYFLAASGSFALTFFMPHILRGTGLSLNLTGLGSGGVWTCSAVGVVLWGWWVDRALRPERAVAAACVLFAVGYGAMALTKSGLLLIPLMCLVAVGSRSAVSSFWSIPSGFIHPAALGVVIAFISGIGNLAGAFGPTVFGAVRDRTGDYSAGMFIGAGLGLLAAVLFWLSEISRRRPAPIGSAFEAEPQTAGG